MINKMKSPALFYKQLEKEFIRCPITKSENWINCVYGDRYEMGIETKICIDSGFIGTNPRPTEKALNEFYKYHYRDYYFGWPDPSLDEYLNSKEYEVAARRAEWLTNFIKPHINLDNKSVLDVGCGDGQFIKKLNQNYKRINLYGIEPDSAYAKMARKTSGATVYDGGMDNVIDDIESEKKSFDLIVMSHVLEHLCEPDKKIRRLKSLLSEDGLLLVEVPNILSPYWSGHGMFHIGHINQFTPQSLMRLLISCNLSPIDFFNGLHPVDPWAMTTIARCGVNKEMKFSPAPVSQLEINSLKKYLLNQSSLTETKPNFFFKFGKNLKKFEKTIRNLIKG